MALRIVPIERISPPAPERFQRDWVGPGRPVVLAGFANDWPARGWTLEGLERRHGEVEVSTVSLTNGRVTMDGRRGLLLAREPLGPVVRRVREGSAERYLMTGFSALPPALTDAVPTPGYLAGAGWTKAVLWVGVAGTVSGMHRDLADNLHTQLAGQKRFWLVSPADSARLRPNGLLHGVPNGCEVELESREAHDDPALEGLEVLEATLLAGDAIYLPRRHWHQVRTMESGISVNHWWASGWRRGLVEAGQLFKKIRGVSR